MRVVLIVNPYAGGKNGKKTIPFIEKRLKQHKIKTQIFTSLYAQHIPKIASDLKIQEFDAIICVGGDGTNYHILNGLLNQFKSKNLPPLGIIPTGSGNSFAKDLNIFTMEDGIDAIVRYKTKSVDVCSFSQENKKFYFVNLTGLGFVTDVAKTAEKFLEKAKTERRLGKRSLIDVLNGETNYINSISNAISSDTDMSLAVYNMLFVMGKLDYRNIATYSQEKTE